MAWVEAGSMADYVHTSEALFASASTEPNFQTINKNVFFCIVGNNFSQTTTQTSHFARFLGYSFSVRYMPQNVPVPSLSLPIFAFFCWLSSSHSPYTRNDLFGFSDESFRLTAGVPSSARFLFIAIGYAVDRAVWFTGTIGRGMAYFLQF